jgi:hypothetical protein
MLVITGLLTASGLTASLNVTRDIPRVSGPGQLRPPSPSA